MNYLAHIYLSEEVPEVLVGNFIADAVHGQQYRQYPEAIQKGILLHRKIDSYTDTHPVYLQSKHRLSQQFDKYSGVIMDIVYDHFLGANFARYHAQDLQNYCRAAESVLQQYRNQMPERCQHFLEYALRNNTFYNYSKLEGIELVLNHLSHRINHGVQLGTAIPLVKIHYRELEEEFFIFFEALKNYSHQQLSLL